MRGDFTMLECHKNGNFALTVRFPTFLEADTWLKKCETVLSGGDHLQTHAIHDHGDSADVTMSGTLGELGLAEFFQRIDLSIGQEQDL